MKIEAQKNEIVIKNSAGDFAIIPADMREDVMKMINSKRFDLIDEIVSNLPKHGDYAEDGQLIDPPGDGFWKGLWHGIKTSANPKNWGKPDMSSEKDFSTAYQKARSAGEKEFVFRGKRYNTRKDTDDIDIKHEFADEYNMLLDSEYPELKKLVNKTPGASNVKFSGMLGNKAQKHYNPATKSLHVGDDDSVDNFIGGIIEELPHAQDFKKTPIKSSLNIITERALFGDHVYNIPNTEEFNTHRIKEPAIALTAYGNLTKSDIRRVQRFLGVKDDGILGDDTYKAILAKYKGSPSFSELVKGDSNTEFPMLNYESSTALLNLLANDVALSNTEKTNTDVMYSDAALRSLGTDDAKGADIKYIQHALSKKGYRLTNSTKKDGDFDGVWGEETEAALKDWQSKNK